MSAAVNTINGCSGDLEISEMWKKHFAALYSSGDDKGAKDTFLQRILQHQDTEDSDTYVINVQDVASYCSKQNKGKAIGLDGIAMEALIYGGHRLHIHLALLFNCFIKTGYLPRLFVQSVIIPLVKCKSGDLTNVNNYRATAISKLFESIIADQYISISDADKYQFGFKPGCSTGLCTSVLKQTVNYSTNRGSHVFLCFVDFSKALTR